MARTPFVALALLAVLSACGDAEEPTPATSPDAPTATAAPEPDATEDPAATEDADTGELVIELTVHEGEVSGAERTTVVPLGTEVTISVLSDVDDEIHVHGYDVRQDVVAGEITALSFVADIPGVFGVELEDAGVQLVELEVR